VESNTPSFVSREPFGLPGSHAVAERSPSPKGRPEGPRAERSDGMTINQILAPPSMNTSAGVLLSRAECFLSLL